MTGAATGDGGWQYRDMEYMHIWENALRDGARVEGEVAGDGIYLLSGGQRWCWKRGKMKTCAWTRLEGERKDKEERRKAGERTELETRRGLRWRSRWMPGEGLDGFDGEESAVRRGLLMASRGHGTGTSAWLRGDGFCSLCLWVEVTARGVTFHRSVCGHYMTRRGQEARGREEAGECRDGEQ